LTSIIAITIGDDRKVYSFMDGEMGKW